MSDEQLKSFLNALWENRDLQDKFKAAGDNISEIIALAKAAGFSINSDDLSTSKRVELSEQDLEGIAGGFITKGCCPWPDSKMSHCGN
jgi:predicted ribosomally synthesized peptide with nif11-like leader